MIRLIAVLALLFLPLAAKAQQGASIYCLTGTSSTGAPLWQPDSTANPCPVTGTVTGTVTAAPVPVTSSASAAVETSHVISAVPATMHGILITTGATAGFLLLLNTTTDPGNGAVLPKKCVQVAANQTTALSPDTNTDWLFSVGIVAVFSTTGCYTETQSATAYFSWQ